MNRQFQKFPQCLTYTNLERTQRAAARWMEGLKGHAFEERLKFLNLQPLLKDPNHKILEDFIDCTTVLKNAGTKKAHY